MAPGPAPLDIAPAPAGRSAEFAEVYRAHFDFVWTQLRRLGVDEGSLEDAAQEVFVVVHRRLDDFVGRSSLRTWLFAIARRVAFRFRRSAARRSRRHEALARQPLAPASPDPEEVIRRGQASRLLAAFLQQLDDDKRAAFVLGELEGLGRVELGQVLGVNPNTAYARLRAAREQFHRVFVDRAARAAILADARVPPPPTNAQRLRVWALVGLGLGGERALVATSATGAATGGLKLFLAAGVISVLSVMLMRAGPKGQDAAEPDRPAPVAASASVGVRTPAPPTVPAETAVAAQADGGRTGVSSPAAQVGQQATRRGDRRAGRKPGVAAVVRETPEALTPAESVGEGASPSPAENDGESAAPPPLLRPRSREQAPGPAPPSSTGGTEAAPLAAEAALAEDVRLLGEARRALAGGTPAAARRLLAQHAAQFPASPLVATRDAMKVAVLCRLGDTAAAQREAAAFLRRHPDSGHAAQVRAGCEGLAP